MEIKCSDIGKFTQKFDDDQLVIQMLGCLPQPGKQTANTVPSSAAALSLSSSSSCLPLPFDALGAKRGLGIPWCILGILVLKLLVFCCMSSLSPTLFFFFLPLLSTVIAALKFIIVLRVLSSHPHSAAETMKKAAMCPMTHEINNPCKQLVGKMSHMSSFWMSGAFQKAGNRGSVKTALADTRVCIRT